MSKVSDSPRPLRLDGYIRVSKLKGREGDSFISPDQQRDQIERWAELRNVQIVEWFEDIDKTGARLERLEAAIDRIRRGESDGIAVARLDRFSRASTMEALKVAGEIIEAGGKISAIDLGVDPTTPSGEFIMTVFLALARMEWRRIKDNWKDSRGRAAERGVHMGPTPFGYVRHGDRGPDGRLLPGQNPPLEIDPDSGPAVSEIFRRRAAGEPWYQIWVSLNARGVLGADGKAFNRHQLKRIVKNDVYLGVVTDGVSETRTEDAHPPLVDYATFRAAQGVRGTSWASKESEALLVGLCRCSSCRYAMYAHRQGQNGNGFLRYDCGRHNRNGDCPGRAMILVRETGRKQYLDRVTASKAAKAVEEDGRPRGEVAAEFGVALRTLDTWRRRWGAGDLEGVAHRGLDDYVIEKVFERLPEIAMRRYGANSRLEQLQAAMESALIRLNEHATDRELEDALGRDAYLARGKALREAAEDAERAHNEELRHSESRLSDSVRRLRDDWETMTVAEKREGLGSIVRYVFVKPPAVPGSQEPISPDRVHVVFFDDPEVDVPRQGRRDYVIRPFEFPGADAHPAGVGEAVG